MRLVAFDTETHLIQPGLLAPPLVCGSFADDSRAWLCNRADTLKEIRRLLLDPEVEICGANIAYDWGVVCAVEPDLLPLIFAAYAADRIYDVSVAQALIDIFEGLLFTDRSTGQPFERYSLERCARYCLGLDLSAEKHGPDIWRLKYATLEHLPLEQWPAAAREYPIGDARHTYDVAKRQKETGNNLHAQAEQARAAFGLHLAALWGMRTDPALVGEVVGEIERLHEETQTTFKAAGFIRPDGTGDKATVKRAVALAYGADPLGQCGTCKGVGKVASEATPKLTKTGKRSKAAPKLKNCAACGATGLDLSGCLVPMTEGGESSDPTISTSRDTLKNSGNELLEEFGESSENEKLFTTYAEILRQGVRVPINPETNVLVNTGRSSYRKPNLQNQPRKGRVRECFVPRPG